ncbi:hypothetical protein Plhal304r1_c036g0110381 [Plasmopara halstedii]
MELNPCIRWLLRTLVWRSRPLLDFAMTMYRKPMLDCLGYPSHAIFLHGENMLYNIALGEYFVMTRQDINLLADAV